MKVGTPVKDSEGQGLLVECQHRIMLTKDGSFRRAASDLTEWKDGKSWAADIITKARTNPNLVIPKGIPSRVLILGTDPEVIIVDKEGKVVPAFTFLTKTPESTVYPDGFAAEFTTTPRRCLEEVADNVAAQLIYGIKPPANTYISHTCLIEVPENMMETASDKDVALGCSPSVNIYDIPPIMVGNPREVTTRVAGCHMHMQLTHNHHRNLELIQPIDLIVLPASMAMLEKFEDTSRRQWYGRPGEIRWPSENRIEYRAFPSTILIHPAIFNWHFDMARFAVDLSTTLLPQLWQGSIEESIAVVMEGDITGARKILARNEPIVKYMMKRKYWYPNVVEAGWSFIMEGLHQYMAAPKDIRHNWTDLHGDTQCAKFTEFGAKQ